MISISLLIWHIAVIVILVLTYRKLRQKAVDQIKQRFREIFQCLKDIDGHQKHSSDYLNAEDL